MKRLLDVVGASMLLILLIPLLLGIALCVRVTFGSPVLFRQFRPGLGGQVFELIKFRTMTDAKDASGRLLEDAQRLTGFGRWLRRWSIDELPELINVIRGDMSLVGPRPLLTDYLPLYSTHQLRRHEVRPGITGWAQINGRNSLSWEERFDLDVWYVEHRSLWLDVRILWLSLWRVLGGRGISQDGHATMPRFIGNGAGSYKT